MTWKNVKGYDGLYEVSDTGLVRTCEKKWIMHHNVTMIKKPKILKGDIGSRGQIRVSLHKDKKYKHYFVHRLVAEAFIPNPSKFKVINHKDFNPSNNNVDNLEWCSTEYNAQYSKENMRKSALNRMTTKTGEHYIYKVNGKFRVMVIRNKKYLPSKMFDNLEDAKEYRKEILWPNTNE